MLWMFEVGAAAGHHGGGESTVMLSFAKTGSRPGPGMGTLAVTHGRCRPLLSGKRANSGRNSTPRDGRVVRSAVVLKASSGVLRNSRLPTELYFNGAMPNPYDVALRARAVRAYESGEGSYADLAALFSVDHRTLERVGSPVARDRFRGAAPQRRRVALSDRDGPAPCGRTGEARRAVARVVSDV